MLAAQAHGSINSPPEEVHSEATGNCVTDPGRSASASRYENFNMDRLAFSNHEHVGGDDLTDVGCQLRRDLRFFLMNPVEKWVARRRFPWKLVLQVLKIVLVTAQLIFFAEFRMTHIRYVDSSTTAFRHLFLAQWDSARDVIVYPPPLGPYGVYTIDAFYDKLTFALNAYYTVNTTAIGSYDYNYEDNPDHSDNIPPPKLCQTNYREALTDPYNDSYSFDTRTDTRCVHIQLASFAGNVTKDLVQEYLQQRNFSVDFDSLVHANLLFALKTIFLKNLTPFDNPDCFSFRIQVTFDNGDHNGQVTVDLQTTIEYIAACSGKIEYEDNRQMANTLIALLDAANVLVCFLSFCLCTRALVRAHKLKQRTLAFFQGALKKEVSVSDRVLFVNFWYIIILVNDVCIVLGTICKISVEYREFDSALFNAAGMLLGIGTLLVWVGLLRYLGFFSHYNVLILTMKRSFPSVMRFIVCAGLLYMGFLFCGWVVLGPYHIKFRTLMTSSECLFALINGDDMFATFNTITADRNKVVYWFSRLYLYIFITLFIYVVLSLFISIIMDAYEVIKERYDPQVETSDLLDFVAACRESPSSGTFREAPEETSFCTRLWSRCHGAGFLRRRNNSVPYVEAD